MLECVWIMVILQQIPTHLHLLFKLNWLLIGIYHWHLAMVTITFIMKYIATIIYYWHLAMVTITFMMKYIATIIYLMNTNMHILFTNLNFILNPN
jgi:hypothetical protein